MQTLRSPTTAAGHLFGGLFCLFNITFNYICCINTDPGSTELLDKTVSQDALMSFLNLQLSSCFKYQNLTIHWSHASTHGLYRGTNLWHCNASANARGATNPSLRWHITATSAPGQPFCIIRILLDSRKPSACICSVLHTRSRGSLAVACICQEPQQESRGQQDLAYRLASHKSSITICSCHLFACVLLTQPGSIEMTTAALLQCTHASPLLARLGVRAQNV